jgi:hypothetical protein
MSTPPPDPTGTRRNPPVVLYAIILGVLVLVAVIVAVIYGRQNENPRPAGSLHSPAPNASVGPSPRY